MREQLFVTIGKERFEVDLPTNAAAVLEFRSNFAGKVNEIGLSRSTTIKLPKTKRNDRIFQLAARPPYVGADNVGWNMFECQWISEGVVVIRSGFLYLSGTSSQSYNAAIMWGADSKFLKWAKADPSLHDLSEARVVWDSTCGDTEWGFGGHPSVYDPNLPALFYAYYNRGYTAGTQLHPCVTLREIFERIKDENGLQIVIDDTSVLSAMENLCLVLTPNNNERLIDQTIVEADAYMPNALYLEMSGIPRVVHDTIIPWHLNQSFNSYVNSLRFVAQPGLGLGGPWFEVTSTFGDLPSFVKLHVWVGYIADGVRYTDTEIICSMVSGNASDAFYCIPEQEVQLVLNSDYGDPLFALVLEWPSGTPQVGRWDSGSIEYHYQQRITDYPSVPFYLAPNLPDISQMDFVKAVCNLFGLFACQQADGFVHLVKFDELFNNMTLNPYNWTPYLIDTDGDDATDVSFDFGLAKENRMAYKVDENDIVMKVSESSIQSDGTTNPETGEFFEFPWAATDNQFIVQYWQDGGGKFKFVQLVHRLMKCQTAGTTGNALSFPSQLEMSYLRSHAWELYARTVSRPKVIKCKFDMNPVEFSNLDFSRPVYLAQFGRYYAIKTIKKTTGNDVTDAELVQLPIWNGN